MTLFRAVSEDAKVWPSDKGAKQVCKGKGNKDTKAKDTKQKFKSKKNITITFAITITITITSVRRQSRRSWSDSGAGVCGEQRERRTACPSPHPTQQLSKHRDHPVF